MSEKLGVRLLGVLFLGLGAGFMIWAHDEALTAGKFSVKMAISGPLFSALGAWFVIEAPEAESPGSARRKMTPLGWVLLSLGFASGILYFMHLGGRLPFLR